MYLSAARVRDRVRLQDDSCTDGRLCYAAPFPAEGGDGEDERRPYGVPLDEFMRQYPFTAGRVDVEMDRCPGAIPRIIFWQVAGEDDMILPAVWRGYEVVKRPPVHARPLFGLGAEETAVPNAQEAAFPVGVAAVAFGVALIGFVASFFIHRSPAGRWYLEGRR